MNHTTPSFKIDQTMILVNLMLITLLTYELANLTWHLLLTHTLTTPSIQQTTTINPIPPKESTLHTTQFNELFGSLTPSTQPNKPIETPIEAPITQLELTLHGILFANNSITARALISSPETSEQTYAINDSLGTSTTIHSIFTDRVILTHNGQQETLYLPDSEGDKKNRSKKITTHPKNNLPPETQTLMGQLWNNFQKQPESILENVQIQPAFINGQFAGVQLFPGKDPTFLEKFGIQAGDTVTVVNGVALTDPLKGMTVLGTLGTATALKFNLLRGQENLSFEFYRVP